MLSNEVISTLNEAAEHHVAYPNSPIYIVKRNRARGCKFFTVLPIAKDHIVFHNYSWLVYMSEDEDFQTNNEATEYVKHRIETLRLQEKYKDIQTKTVFFDKLSETDRDFLENCINNMRNSCNDTEKYKEQYSMFYGYVFALINMHKITKEEAHLLVNNLM